MVAAIENFVVKPLLKKSTWRTRSLMGQSLLDDYYTAKYLPADVSLFLGSWINGYSPPPQQEVKFGSTKETDKTS